MLGIKLRFSKIKCTLRFTRLDWTQMRLSNKCPKQFQNTTRLNRQAQKYVQYCHIFYFSILTCTCGMGRIKYFWVNRWWTFDFIASLLDCTTPWDRKYFSTCCKTTLGRLWDQSHMVISLLRRFVNSRHGADGRIDDVVLNRNIFFSLKTDC